MGIMFLIIYIVGVIAAAMGIGYVSGEFEPIYLFIIISWPFMLLLILFVSLGLILYLYGHWLKDHDGYNTFGELLIQLVKDFFK